MSQPAKEFSRGQIRRALTSSLAESDNASSQTSDSSTTLVTNTYRTLRREILGGSLRPNQLLVEADIAERLGVSRMPVRESLQRLLGDGLVELRKRRWIVHEFTRDEIIEIYQIRKALESAAASLASQNAGATQLAELKKAADAIGETQTRPDFIVACENFNRIVIELGGNRRFERMLTLNSAYYATYQLITSFSQADVEEYARRYLSIYAAIASGDTKRVEQVVRHYVDQTLDTLLRRLFRAPPH